MTRKSGSHPPLPQRPQLGADDAEEAHPGKGWTCPNCGALLKRTNGIMKIIKLKATKLRVREDNK